MRTRRTAVMLLLGMGSAAAFAEWARPTIKVSDLHKEMSIDTLFPKQFGEWRVDESLPVIVPPPDQQAMLDKIYNQTLARTYVNRSGRRIMLSVAYGGDQSDGLGVHIPEVCYVSQGFKLESTQDDQMLVDGHTIPVRNLMTSLGSRLEPITYWVLMGDEATISTAQRRWISIRYGLKRMIPEGMLVRVSSINPNLDDAVRLHAEFINTMIQAVPVDNRIRIVGRLGSAIT